MSDWNVTPKRNVIGRFLISFVRGVLGFLSLIVIFSLYRVYRDGAASLSEPSFLTDVLAYCVLVAVVSFILSIVKVWQEPRRTDC